MFFSAFDIASFGKKAFCYRPYFVSILKFVKEEMTA